MSEMIQKLKKHLNETPIQELKKEWKEVEDFANVGPKAKDLVKTLQDINNMKNYQVGFI